MLNYPETQHMNYGTARVNDAKVLGDANSEQVARVREVLDDEELLAVWATNPSSLFRMLFSCGKMLILLPFLPIFLPMMACGYVQNKKTLYYLTNKGTGTLMVSLCGTNNIPLEWDNVDSIKTDTQNSCCCFRPYDSVKIMKREIVIHTRNGHAVGQHQNCEHYHVKNPKEVAAIMKEAEKVHAQVVVPVVVQSTICEPIRVFVAHTSSPDDRKLAMIDPSGSWDEVCAALSTALGGLTVGSVALVAAGGPAVAVSSAEHITANDALLVSAY
eukprot:TRINITY_DN6323_c0_g1_i14.p1 TRINITY_DN6323_c0_g1~~TRINITY_DN6323_c0_g1_i14.p1  ORF type:complete len:272 (+),score=30.02 TRINITY_DN6323_c0_g1_i14:70-885(+)